MNEWELKLIDAVRKCLYIDELIPITAYTLTAIGAIEGRGITSLATCFGCGKGAAVNKVKTLIDKGYVCKRGPKHYLTPSGRVVYEKVNSRLMEAVRVYRASIVRQQIQIGSRAKRVYPKKD